jgi:DeoR/GlpR family transcriptional regulator of sugar metabolism
MPTDSTERKLRAALERLVAGHPIRTDGRFTVTGLAREAGVSRATAHRYPDVLADLAAAGRRPPIAASTDGEPESTLAQRNEELTRENASLRAEKEALANAVYALAELIERQASEAEGFTNRPAPPLALQ